jgi:hypothetical protein
MEVTFNIPIHSDEDVKRANELYNTDYKTTQQHLENAVDDIIDLIGECGDRGGWYIGDSLRITVKVKYCPEDK